MLAILLTDNLVKTLNDTSSILCGAQAELKILSGDSQSAAGQPLPPTSISSSNQASNTQQTPNTRNALAAAWQSNGASFQGKASAFSKSAKAAAGRLKSATNPHRATGAEEGDSDTLPDLMDSDSDSSPTFSFSQGAGAGSSSGHNAACSSHSKQKESNDVSGQSSPISYGHNWMHGQAHLSGPASSDSEDSDSSPCMRHLPDSKGSSAAGSAGMNGHAAVHQMGSHDTDMSQPAQSFHHDSADSDTADEDDGSDSANTKRDMDIASTYFKQSAEAIRDHDWQSAVRHSYVSIKALTCSRHCMSPVHTHHCYMHATSV